MMGREVAAAGSGSTQDDTPRVAGTEVRPYLYRVLEAHRPTRAPSRHALDGLEVVAIGRGDDEARRTVEDGKRTLHLAISDPRVSAVHAHLRFGIGRWVVEDAGARNGVYRNGTRITGRAALGDGDVLELGQTFFVFRAGQRGDGVTDLEAPVTELVSLVPTLRAELARLEEVARSMVSVLLIGDTGTGKERVAHAVHARSGRPGAFVAVHGATLEERSVREAERGTLYVDELSDLSPPSQLALLRALEEPALDFRFTAATRHAIDQLVGAGVRADLIARLSGYSLRLPPLRERREDLGLVIGELMRRCGRCVTFSKEAARALLAYRWPFNIRELAKALEAAIVVAGEQPIAVDHLPAAITGPSAAPPQLSSEDRDRREAMIALLTEHQGNVSAVARAMAKERVQIRRWLQRYQLDPEEFKRR